MGKYISMRVVVFLFFVSLLSSCENKAGNNKPGERAVLRWNAIIDKNWEVAYQFETPNYRSVYSEGDYKASFGNAIVWKDIEFRSTKITNKLAEVKLVLTTVFSGFGADMTVPSVITERWQNIDGEWWHVLE